MSYDRRTRHADYFVAGTTNTVCDDSGFKVKRNQTKMRWDEFLVIDESWNPRQPQDFGPRIVKQRIIPDARPVREQPIETAPIVKPI